MTRRVRAPFVPPTGGRGEDKKEGPLPRPGETER